METGKQEIINPKSYVIANPIYDTVFKRLMENERIAKFFLNTILEEQVVSIEVRPQEFTYKKDEKIDKRPEDIGYSIFRIDYMATIKTDEGVYKKILIEVQKSWDEKDLMRFRNYLGEQYKKVDKVNDVDIVLPITTIYVIGFPLVGIDSPCIKVERNYKDMLSGELIETRSSFLEQLSHNNYVIHISRISNKRYSTKLEELLSIFEQAHFVKDDSKISKLYPHRADDEDIKFITYVLHETIADPIERAEIEKEAEALRILDDAFFKTKRTQDKIIEEQAKILEEQDIILKEQNIILEEQDKILKEQKALEERVKALKEQIKTISERNKALEERAKQIEELKRLLGKQ
jgi:hypothetical protein